MSGDPVRGHDHTTSSIIPPGRVIPLPGGGSTFVRDSGGPPGSPTVLLLHGLGVTADLNWATSMPALSRDFRVVAPDLRGHGQAVSSNHAFTLEAAADDVAAVADALRLRSFVAVGYSMGGAIAPLLWRRHPALVEGLVLCATSRSFRGTVYEHLLFDAAATIRAAARVIPDAVPRAVVRKLAGALVERRSTTTPADPYRQFALRPVMDAASQLGGYRSHDWIGDVDVPAAVLVHTRDHLVPPRRQFGLARAIPGADVHLVDGSHLACVREPDAFVAALLAAVHGVVDRSAGAIARAS